MHLQGVTTTRHRAWAAPKCEQLQSWSISKVWAAPNWSTSSSIQSAHTTWVGQLHILCTIKSWDLETLVDFLSGQIWLRHRVVPQISTSRCMLDPIDILVITVSNTTSVSMLDAALILTLCNVFTYHHLHQPSCSNLDTACPPSPLPNCLIPWIGRFPNVEIFNLRSLQFELGDSQQFGPGCINYIQMSTTSMKSNNQMRTIIWY